MQEIVKEFANEGQLIMDPRSGAFTMATVSLMLSKEQRFSGCKIDPVNFIVSVSTISDRFAMCVLNSK